MTETTLSSIQCHVVSPERDMFKGDVVMCQINGRWGGLTILPKHVPLLTTIQPGTMTLRRPNGHEEVFIFLEACWKFNLKKFLYWLIP